MDEQPRSNTWPVTARCERCARTSPKAPALAIIDPDGGRVSYVTRMPSTVTVAGQRMPAAEWEGRTLSPPVRGRVALFECRECGAKPRVKRGTLLRDGAAAHAAGRDVIYL